MKWAKKEGFEWYDWWGIENHGTWNMEHGIKIRDWEGITRFKRGFVSPKTGKVVECGETMDVVVSRQWYKMFLMLKKLIKGF